jgi:biopolymer transport protein ExbB
MSAKRFLRVLLVCVAVGFVMAACSQLAMAADQGERHRMTFWNMVWIATTENFFAFLDKVVIWSFSVLSIALIIQSALLIRRTTLVPELAVAQIKTMFDEHRFREALEFCQTDPSFVAGVVHAGLIEAANGYEAMQSAMEDAAAERTGRLYRKIEWLNLIGNVTPLCGLTGTIWGMMTAFATIEAKGGKANPSDLAGGILIALVSTFSGLMTAIPALVSYGIFKGKVEQLSMESALVAEELLSNFRPAKEE